MFCFIPSSLLTWQIVTKIVSFVSLFFRSSKSTLPFSSSSIYSTINPFFSKYLSVSIILECSSLVVRILFPLFLYLLHIPLIAVLLDSLAPLVYIISLGSIFNIELICFVASSINSFELTPKLCNELGFPIKFLVTLTKLSNTSSLTGVVA